MSRYVNLYMVPKEIYDQPYYNDEVNLPDCNFHELGGKSLLLPSQLESIDYDFLKDYFQVTDYSSYEYYQMSVELLEAWEMYKKDLIVYWYDNEHHEKNIAALSASKANGFNIYMACH